MRLDVDLQGRLSSAGSSISGDIAGFSGASSPLGSYPSTPLKTPPRPAVRSGLSRNSLSRTPSQVCSRNPDRLCCRLHGYASCTPPLCGSANSMPVSCAMLTYWTADMQQQSEDMGLCREMSVNMDLWHLHILGMEFLFRVHRSVQDSAVAHAIVAGCALMSAPSGMLFFSITSEHRMFPHLLSG